MVKRFPSKTTTVSSISSTSLLKNPENLDVSRNEAEHLNKALALNQPLATAYYMKEELRQFWEQEDKVSAGELLFDWVRRAEASASGPRSGSRHRTRVVPRVRIPFSFRNVAGRRTGGRAAFDCVRERQ